MYNETVPPVILDGGKDILLANFQGPRSLKCEWWDWLNQHQNTLML